MRLKEIKNLNQLSKLLEIDRNTLNSLLNREYREKLYKVYAIPKKDGSERQICAPQEPLKSIQKRISELLWREQLWINHEKEEQYIKKNKMIREEKQRYISFTETIEDYNSGYRLTLELKKNYRFQNNTIQGFEKGKSILTNAALHRKKKYIINIDLKDFFDSFTFYRVRGYFEHHKDFLLSREIAMTLANLVCYKSKLPQGAPSSPILTNMIGRILDSRIRKLCKKFRLKYTRYADDMTFSTNDDDCFARVKDFLHELNIIVEDAGFTVNDKKSRICYWYSRQTVTGLIVNKRISVSKKYYKATRGMAHQLYIGREVYVNKEKVDNPIKILSGRFAFINQVDQYSDNILGLERNIFSTREKTFQRFLFYKYFYGIDRPMLVTEGKTDIRYIRASLKKLNKKFPELINLENDGKAKYSITFLKKSTVLEKYLGLNKHGGSIFEKIWNLYLNNNLFNNKNFGDIYNYFKRIGSPYKSPVIMLFDNELDELDRPIKQFLDKYKRMAKNIFEKEYEESKRKKIQNLKLDGKTSEEIKKEIKNFETKFCDEKKEKIKEELREREWIHIKDNLYLMLIPDIESGTNNSDIESLLLSDDIKKVDRILEKEFNSSDKDFVEKKNYGKNHLSKHIMYNYQNFSFQNFEKLFENIKSIIQDNKNRVNKNKLYKFHRFK